MGFPRTPRTDLAIEAHEMLTRQVQEPMPGVIAETLEDDDVEITRVIISSPQAAEKMGKAEGTYITLQSPGLRYKNTPLQQKIMNLFAQQLVGILSLPLNTTILVVGLGNWDVTPDALGPRTVSKIVVTRHLQGLLSPELKDGVRSVCSIAPGVLGNTGMETAEIVKGIVMMVKPNVVIAVDALAAASSYRMNTTIQVANCGIHPGSGVGNRRFGLTQEYLGVPVVAVGVPTVVHAGMIANDTLDVLQEHSAFSRYFKSLQTLSPEDKHAIVRQVLPDLLGDLMVTPKEIDRLIDDMADVVAGGINQAMHPNIDYHNIHKYLH